MFADEKRNGAAMMMRKTAMETFIATKSAVMVYM